MPAKVCAQPRELRKNYIDVVSHQFDEQCSVELQAKCDHVLKNYLSRLVAVVLKRRAGSR
jgi:DNA phosphorothioation-dependent restriction protein DptG